MASSKKTYALVSGLCLLLLAQQAMSHTWGHHRPSFRKPYERYGHRGLHDGYGSYGRRDGGYGSSVSVSPAAHHGSEGPGQGAVGISPFPTDEGVLGAPPVATDGGKGHLHLVGGIEGLTGAEASPPSAGFPGEDSLVAAPGLGQGVRVSDIDLRGGPAGGE
ncbi:collagen alpha-1(VIII) chain-like [Penaeus chinensis]|uniref:collagen alpha-1(VIII) chain-like n=1 Tax=Penaeus chinensis TaxID=139456 RepID=UPI001FB6BC54|nr:collagen alpha-1(VIII) chain-like [Penaeus chinensis]